MAHHEISQDEVPGGSAEHEESHGTHHAEHGEASASLMTIEQAHHNKHHRQMHRTLRWPIHSNTPRITF
ncbi:MAG: hypothetical protein ACOY3M_01805 [Patescibacteria group bacterium]